MKPSFAVESSNQSSNWTKQNLSDLKGLGSVNVGTIFRANDVIYFPANEAEADIQFQPFTVTKEDGTQEVKQIPLMKMFINDKCLHVSLASFRKLPYGTYAQDWRLAHPVNDELLAGDYFDFANKCFGKVLKVASLGETKKAKFIKGRLHRDEKGNAILEDCKMPVWAWGE